MHPFLIKLVQLSRSVIDQCQKQLKKIKPVLSRVCVFGKSKYRQFVHWLNTKLDIYRPIVKDRIKQYSILCRMNKPIGILLLLWPTLWALWIAAEGIPDIKILIIFVAGVFLTRSAGCVMNDLADRNLDGHIDRTKDRPIVTGTVSVKEATLVAAGLMLLAFILVLQTNELTIYLACIAFLLAALYPLMKRYTYLPQFVLGVAFGWGIPMAFAAQLNAIPAIAWLILIANILWSVAYDTMYAMIDREDDIKIGVKSTAILFAEHDTLIIAIIQSMLILTLVLVGLQLELGRIYNVAIILATLMAIYQQILIKRKEPAKCFQAFLNNNWFGAVIFLGIFLHYHFFSI